MTDKQVADMLAGSGVVVMVVMLGRAPVVCKAGGPKVRTIMSDKMQSKTKS